MTREGFHAEKGQMINNYMGAKGVKLEQYHESYTIRKWVILLK